MINPSTSRRSRNGPPPAPGSVPGSRPTGRAIAASGLIAGYRSQNVVHGIDLRVEPGEVVALLGPNGAGKTTTMSALAGTIEHSGSVRFLGRRAGGSLWERAERGLAFLPESRAIVRKLTVAENLKLARVDRDAAIAISPELEALLDRPGSALSGGEQQILSLTQAIAAKPAVLLADELSFGLAPIVVRRMLELARGAADDGAAVLLVEQFARQVLGIADRAYVMRHGSIITAGTAEYLLSNIETVEASYLGGEPLRSQETVRAERAASNATQKRKKKRMLDGKTIVVTGVASGIGAETASELTRQGATVIGVDRHAPGNEFSGRFHQVDISEAAGVDAVLDALPDGIDGLCNIAGVPPTQSADMVLRVNVIGLRRVTEGLIPKLSDGAAITNLASLAGIGWTQSVDQVKEVLSLDFGDDIVGFCKKHRLGEDGRSYFLSKEALQVYTMKNRWTWRERGIRMNCVSPGPVETPILKDFVDTLGERAAEDMEIMDRPGTPADVAPVVAFLQSEAAVWFRGANLALDGGMSSHIMLQMNGVER